MENMFDQDFFFNTNQPKIDDIDNYANESIMDSEHSDYDGALEDMGPALFGLGLIIINIKTLVKAARHDKMTGVFLDVDKIIQSGLPKEQAISEYKKTLKFLINKKFVKPNINMKSTVVLYDDLTENGKEFIRGYFDKISKIDTFTIEKSLEADKFKNIAHAKAGNIFLSIIATLIELIGASMAGGILGITVTVLALITGGLSIVSDTIGGRSEIHYNKNKPSKYIDAKESIFDYDYFEDTTEDIDMHDYEYNGAYEDVDLFDDGYFEATEGNKENKFAIKKLSVCRIS